jgi:hypothetical protein
VSVQTPNDVEFSIAAKIYICSGRVLPPGGFASMWTSPTGEGISGKTLCETAVAAQFDWLEANGYIQATPSEVKQLLGAFQTYTVHAVYSSAPGFGGRLLEATGWQDAPFIHMVEHMIGRRSQDPVDALLRSISQEFRDAGILHGSDWNKEWLDYLVTQWGREAWDVAQRVHVRPDYELLRRNVVAAIGSMRDHSDDRDD